MPDEQQNIDESNEIANNRKFYRDINSAMIAWKNKMFDDLDEN